MQPQSQPKAQPSMAELLPVFQELLPSHLIRAWLAESGQRFYERLFTPLVMVWGLIYQRLHQDHTCDAVVAYLGSGAADRLDERHAQPLSARLNSENTSAFCQARERLPLSVLSTALCQTAAVVRQWAGGDGLWLDHPVYLLDGSTLLLRPWPELVAHYGQRANQTGPLYWIVMRVVVSFCLRTGAVQAVAEGPLTTSEQDLARGVLSQAAPGSVQVGDRNFGVFKIVQVAQHAGTWVVLRLTKTRAAQLARTTRQPSGAVAVRWTPSKQDHVYPDLPTTPIAGRLITMTVERDGFRPEVLYLFTTLLDAQRYPPAALVELYGWRWHVELDLRYVKETLNIALLHAKRVDTVRKELWAGLLAYNLIRAVMLRAAQAAHCAPLTLSFTACWRRVADALLHACQSTNRIWQRLLVRLGRCRIAQQPSYRIEPRATRRRPLAYAYLKGSRQEAREEVRRSLAQGKS